jgi:predicted ABC-type ATPase
MIEPLLAALAKEQPTFILLAGPNGAGKSTFRKVYLEPANFLCFDPDQESRKRLGRDPRSRDEAVYTTKELDARVTEQFKSKTSFALETVFSDGEGYKLDLIRKAQKKGYIAGVIYIGLDDPQLSVARVVDRVQNGGHDVPDGLIHSRFPRSLENLKKAIPLADFVLFVDNSGETRHRVFGMHTREDGLNIWDRAPRWFENLHLAV